MGDDTATSVLTEDGKETPMIITFKDEEQAKRFEAILNSGLIYVRRMGNAVAIRKAGKATGVV